MTTFEQYGSDIEYAILSTFGKNKTYQNLSTDHFSPYFSIYYKIEIFIEL